ncbi:MAG: hypothetical protein R2855_04860 [Thermomicrobiales bacterium]
MLTTSAALLDTVQAANAPLLTNDRIVVPGEHPTLRTFDEPLASTASVPVVDIDPERTSPHCSAPAERLACPRASCSVIERWSPPALLARCSKVSRA